MRVKQKPEEKIHNAVFEFKPDITEFPFNETSHKES